MGYTQDDRLMALDTPLGKDVLLITSFSGTEGLSRLFSFEISALSENDGISFDSIVGRNVTVSIVLPDNSYRYFNGIVVNFSRQSGTAEAETDLTPYNAVIAPWLWLLDRTTDSRIFQELKVPDIIEKIFTEKGFNDYRMDLDGSYEKREYCVQYRETDFNFVSRLMEEEGIYYYFEHERGKHTLVLTDSSGKHRPCPNAQTASMRATGGPREPQDMIASLQKTMEIRAGKYTLNDFNFKIPNTDLKVTAPTRVNLGPGEREYYDYPGEYDKRGVGNHFATVRMEEQEARITTIMGSSSCRAFTSGYFFTLKDSDIEDLNDKNYLLTSLGHGAWQGGYHSGVTTARQTEGSAYTNNFRCIPMETQYRPRQTTPRPTVRGSQTAIVVGPQGEEIYTDEHGRVKVQFHWDREGKKDEKSSCWIRVSQLWAGAGWGAMFIPRIGHEVIVDFLEGNPDRPIITGRVYHGMNKPPYPLSDEKTKSTVKSESTIGGNGFNEIRFEDKKGSEEIYIHAERNRTIEVEADEYHTIGHDHTIKIDNNDTKEVKGKQDITVFGAVTINHMTGVTVTVGASGVTVNSAGPISVTAPSITFHTPVLQVDGIVSCTTLTASVGVTSPSYSPGVGNVW